MTTPSRASYGAHVNVTTFLDVLGAVVRFMRRGVGSQADVAAAAGLKPSTLSRIENGRLDVTVVKLRRLAVALRYPGGASALLTAAERCAQALPEHGCCVANATEFAADLIYVRGRTLQQLVAAYFDRLYMDAVCEAALSNC